MSVIDVKDMKNWSVQELQTKLEEQSTSLQRLKFDHASKGTDTPLMIRSTRRDIARLKTELRSRQLIEIDPANRTRIRNRRRNK